MNYFNKANINAIYVNNLDIDNLLKKLKSKKYDVESYGRNNIKIIDEKFIVRKYTHGGLFSFILKDNFFSPKRVIQEFLFYNFLNKNNIASLEVCAAIWIKKNQFYEIYLVTKLKKNIINLYEFLKDSKKDNSFLINLFIEIILKIHNKNIYHSDLQIKNFLFSEDKNKVYVIDFDNSYFLKKIHIKDRLSNLFRFIRSLKKNKLDKKIDCNKIINGYLKKINYKKNFYYFIILFLYKFKWIISDFIYYVKKINK